MSAAADRIAEVLDDHRPWTTWGLTDDGIYCGGCERRYTAFTAHVAERIEAALQQMDGLLIHDCNSHGNPCGNPECVANCRICVAHYDAVGAVSAWSEVQQ